MTVNVKNDLAALYIKVIADELSLIAKKEESGDFVTFKYPELGTFVITLDESDPEFLRILFPDFTDARLTGGDSNKLLALVNQVNRKNKAVKLTVDDVNDVTLAIEFFVAGKDELPTEEHLKKMIARTLSAMRAGIASLLEAAKAQANSI